MTREEAIREWTFRSNHIKRWLAEYGEEPSIIHYVELIDMAIEALQREEAEAKGYCHRIKPKQDLISRADAIELCAEAQGRASTKSELEGISKVWQGLLKLPSAEAVHGEWILDGGTPICSVCHKEPCWSSEGYDFTDFCPNCGALMQTE